MKHRLAGMSSLALCSTNQGSKEENLFVSADIGILHKH